MKKLILALVLAGPLLADAATYTRQPGAGSRRDIYSATQSLTQAAPSGASEGIQVPDDPKGCFVTAQADSGATITNLVLTSYIYDPTVALWGRGNLTPFVPVAGGTAAAVGQISVTGITDRTFTVALASEYLGSIPKGGRIDFVSTGTTVSAGALTVFLSCW
jgi:hypothetical protein